MRTMDTHRKAGLAVIVLNWNHPENTIDCVQSLKKQEGVEPFDIFIIDNGSTDDSVAQFHTRFPDIEVVENGRNLGFQGGMNTGIKLALKRDYTYVMLLNDDTVATPDMLATLIRLMPADAHLVSPGIYYISEPDLLCSLGNDFNPLLLESTSPHKKSYAPPAADVLRYEFLPAHAWLVKTDVFKEIGLIDESYFPLYYDDLDFCLRMTRRGFKLYLIPPAKLLHKISVSMGGQNSPNERYFMARNSAYYFRKHMRFWNVPFVVLFRFGSALSWTARLLTQKNPEAVKHYWKGLRDGWFGELPVASFGGWDA